MKEVYDEDYYNSIKNGTSQFDTFDKNSITGNKVKCIKNQILEINVFIIKVVKEENIVLFVIGQNLYIQIIFQIMKKIQING